MWKAFKKCKKNVEKVKNCVIIFKATSGLSSVIPVDKLLFFCERGVLWKN
jgi:hypothetical protein